MIFVIIHGQIQKFEKVRVWGAMVLVKAQIHRLNLSNRVLTSIEKNVSLSRREWWPGHSCSSVPIYWFDPTINHMKLLFLLKTYFLITKYS